MQLKVPLEVPTEPAPVIVTPPTSSGSSSDATAPNRESRSNNSSPESITSEETPPRKFFETACPGAYSYAYDDVNTGICSPADYTITFCPVYNSRTGSSLLATNSVLVE
ncbi:hypothetical protein L6164_023238 [Bauhinia variegata]|uniref:Uncharacterized protein n=1 Tax=Bauhinia variegata TaxID=167791 RepID=A0ACB9MHQ8_BAUVA|nr:hypothetical protein L6164_023238 [Bauhinia variegata]